MEFSLAFEDLRAAISFAFLDNAVSTPERLEKQQSLGWLPHVLAEWFT